MNFLFSTPINLDTQIIFIAVITLLTILSVVRGLDKGIRVLSNFTMILAALLLAFLLIFGPAALILTSYGEALGQYVQSFSAIE